MDTKKLRQKILDLAIRGKLVPQDPNDEPASVLLERIKTEKERLIKEGKIKRSKMSASDTSHYENVPFEIPESWEWTKLENFVLAITDGDHLPPPQALEGVPFLVISDVNTGVISFEKSRFVSEEYYRSLPNIRKATKGDLLFTVTGSYGIVVPVETERKFCFQRHIGLIKTIKCTSWISSVLQSNYVQTYCDKVATGTAQKTVSLGHLRDLLIPIPPLDEQERIVSQLDVLLDAVGKLQKSEKDLHQAIGQTKSKVLELAISGKLVPQDMNDEPASKLLMRINPNIQIPCDNPHYQKLPNGWAMTTMYNICQLRDGEKQSNVPRINLDVKYLRGKSEGEIVSSGKFVPAGSTMILVDGENSGEIFTPEIDGYQGSTFKLLDINSEMNIGFVLLVIKSHQQEFRENKVGSAIPHLNKKLFKEIPVMIPPVKEQQRIVEVTQQYLNLLGHISDIL